eukprot:Em0021g252a
MGERKVLNKYYPPDFDPAKIPKIAIPKDRQYVVRLMAPFTMRCLTCGDYVYKGRKFNARKETAIGETYLGIQIYRFYIRCPKCLSEITFKTDPVTTDYIAEQGAYRTFQAGRLAEQEEERKQQEKEEEEAGNPMLALENRTKESRREMDVLDALEEIRDMNARHAQVNLQELIEKHADVEKRTKEQEEEEDEALVKAVFSKPEEIVKRVVEDQEEEEEQGQLSSGHSDKQKEEPVAKKSKLSLPEPKASAFSKKVLSGLVKRKPSLGCTPKTLPVHTVATLRAAVSSTQATVNSTQTTSTAVPQAGQQTVATIQSSNSLGALCAYSDDSDQSD